MSKVKVKIKMDKSKLFMLEKAQRDAAKETMEAVKREIERDAVVPRDMGTLEESIKVTTGFLNKGNVVITYNTPYARRLYFHPEYNFHREPWIDDYGNSHDGNANAKGKWLEDYESGGKKENFIRDTYASIYRRLIQP